MGRGMRIVLVVVACLLVVPVAAVASDRFTDVPESNVFHNDIAWLAEAGVTLGCNPPANDEFCPGDNVTRQQMAAFMHRLAENRVVDAGQLDGRDAVDYETLVWSRSCGIGDVVMGTPVTTCLPGSGGKIPDGAVSQVFAANIEVPASGALQLSSTALGTDTIAWSFTIDRACSNDAETFITRAVNGHVWGAATGTAAAAHFTTDAPVGTHTLRLCGINNSGAAVDLVTSSLTAQWTAGGSVNIAGNGGSPTALLSEADLLGS